MRAANSQSSMSHEWPRRTCDSSWVSTERSCRPSSPSGSITQRIQLQATVMRPDTSTDALRGAAAVRMRLLRAMSSHSEASERR